LQLIAPGKHEKGIGRLMFATPIERHVVAGLDESGVFYDHMQVDWHELYWINVIAWSNWMLY
jgi:hypothetical protein